MVSLKKEKIVMEASLPCTHVRVCTKHRKNFVLCNAMMDEMPRQTVGIVCYVMLCNGQDVKGILCVM